MEREAVAHPADSYIGMVLQDRYRILRKLGDGGMGSVYEAEHLGIKKRVAIKMLHQQYARDPEMIVRFQREAQAATAIGHPNIVDVLDIARLPDGTPYMLLEFLDGRDWLKDMKRDGPQPLGKVAHILCQVCDAIGVAHAIGIVHRDMKPENIFLMQRGPDPNFVKVVDFGISKMLDRSESSVTETGTALGTPFYMSPEQCQGQHIDGRADIYSLGVILFKALTGEYPFADKTYPMMILKICTEPPPPLSDYRADLPPQIQAILDRMLAKRREDRFATCSQLRAALEPFRDFMDAPSMVANPPSTANRGPAVLAPPKVMLQAQAPVAQPSRLRSWFLLGGAALVFVIALAFVALMVVMALSRDEPVPVATPSVRPPIEAPAPQREEHSPEPRVNIAPQPAAEAPVTQRPATVHVHISATPATAQMFLDGDPIGNPFEADVPRDPDHVEGQPPRYHLLRAQAPGYRTHEQQLVFRYDNMSYPLVLQRGRANNVVRVPAEQYPIAPRPAPIARPAPLAPSSGAQRSVVFGPRPQPSSSGQTVGQRAVFGGP